HFLGGIKAYAQETRGAAAVEFALWLTMLAIPIFTVIDVSFYVQEKMQVQNAAQAAAQLAWSTCGASSTQSPATTNCVASGATLNSAITAGAHSTSLGSSVTVANGADSYYCLNASNNLTLVGTAGVIGSSGTNTA